MFKSFLKDRPSASVIIRTKNEIDNIAETLNRVSEQVYRQKEIIVVDSGSTDGTVELIERIFLDNCPLRIITIPTDKFSFGFAANLGAKYATGDIIVYLSAHALPISKFWLAELIVPFENPEIVAVSGSQNGKLIGFSLPPTKPIIIDYDYFRKNWIRNFKERYYAPGLHLGNAAIRRSIWQEISFNEKLLGLEDKEWSYRALQKGYKIFIHNSANVIHLHQEDYYEKFIRSFREHHGFREFLSVDYGITYLIKDFFNFLFSDVRFFEKQIVEKSIFLAGRYWGLFYDNPPDFIKKTIESEPIKNNVMNNFFGALAVVNSYLGKDLNWMIVGSYALYLQGRARKKLPKDIDIFVKSEAVLKKIEENLSQFLVKNRFKILPGGGEQICLEINNIPIELFYVSDRRCDYNLWLEKAKMVELKNVKVPCISLQGELDITKTLINIRGVQKDEQDKLEWLTLILQKTDS